MGRLNKFGEQELNILTIPALLVVLVISLTAPAVFKPLLLRLGVLDIPNTRSSHTRPTIRGAGLAPLLALVTGYSIVLFGVHDAGSTYVLWIIIGTTMAAGLLGGVEDLRGLPVRVRAVIQLAIGALGSGLLSLDGNVDLWQWPVFAFALAAYINVTNFMDGIDGISSFHAVVVGTTYAGIGVIYGLQWMIIAGLILGVAFAGFLPWNLGSEKMFLGDVGSYLLGGGVAVVAIAAFVQGIPILAILGPGLIYLADTGVTLVRRIVRRERWFEAHRSHVYQRLTDSSLTHLEVAGLVSLASASCALLGILAVGDGQVAAWIGMGAVVASYLLSPAILSRLPKVRNALEVRR